MEGRDIRPWRVGAAVFLALAWLAMLLVGTDSIDDRVLHFFYAGGKPVLIAVARVFTFLGEPTMLIGLGLVAAAWLYWRRSRGYALAVVLVTLLGRGLAEVQKYAIGRHRPADVVRLVHTYTPSFPSGHATSSMIVYVTLALVLTTSIGWRRIAVAAAILLSLCIGLSRLMLGAHWPSDVIAGWSFGGAWVLLALPLSERFAARYTLKRNSITSPS